MDNSDDEDIHLSTRAKVLVPLLFIGAGIFSTCVLPRYCSWKRSRERLQTNAVTASPDSDENQNLSEQEIKVALVIKSVLPAATSHTFNKSSQNDHEWWNILKHQKSNKNIDKAFQQVDRTISSFENKSLSSSSLSCSNSCEEDINSLGCQICLETFQIGDRVAIPKQKNPSCDHIFHEKCISSWLKRSNTCPCCRVTYVDMEEIIQSEKKSRFFRSFRKNKAANEGYDHIMKSQFCQTHGLIFPSCCNSEVNKTCRRLSESDEEEQNCDEC